VTVSSFGPGASIDYVRGENLIKSIIHQIKDLRNEDSFRRIYVEAKALCDANNIDFYQEYRSRRATTIPARFAAFVIESPVGQREILSSSADFMNRIFFPLIDCMLVELNDRFSLKTLSLMKSMSTVYPDGGNFLSVDDVFDFSEHIGADPHALKNEFMVLKPLLESKAINNVMNFLNELIPLSQAFPQTIKMITNALTMPISQVTCERSFSKMKIIKNYLRNSMTDQRLSDLTVLAVERDFEMDFERVIDQFSINHKNSRIMLR
jgi:hAT family C-terminal dimerisation region